MERIEWFEGERAQRYDELIPTAIPLYDEVFRLVATCVHDRCPEKAHILSVGCGTGKDLAPFIGNPNYRLTGIDPSPDMISQARRRYAHETTVTLIQTTCSAFHPNDRFDVALLMFVFHFMPDDGTKTEMLKNIHRLLSPGGALILFDINQTPEKRLYKQVWRRYMQDEAGYSDEALEAYMNRIQFELNPVSEDRMVAIAREAGFSTVTRLYQWLSIDGWIIAKSTDG